MSTLEWKIGELEEYVGRLSKPSKMPGLSYSIPAARCKIGAKLQKIAGSVCSGCYALKGAYPWPSTQKAMERRYNTLQKPLWASAMASLLSRKMLGGKLLDFFRWHDSGDLQSVEHLANIVEVCKQTPGVQHWLPTREYRIVNEYIDLVAGLLPDNLNIRLSAHMIGGHVPTFPRLTGVDGITISTVSQSDDDFLEAHHCPARHQDNHCGDCRACWDRDVPHVTYPLH